jgi:hypothetical protein
MGRADGDAALSVKHSGRSWPQLGQRDRDGHADRAQGAMAGAKVQALTLLDLLLTPKVITDAWDYFRNVQTKDRKYIPFIRPVDQPAIWLNTRSWPGTATRCGSSITIRRSSKRTSISSDQVPTVRGVAQ